MRAEINVSQPERWVSAVGGAALTALGVKRLGGFLDEIPFGAAFAKGLTFKMGQTHVMRYLRPLLDCIERMEIDPSFVITHRVALDDGPVAYATFRDKRDHCIKVVIKPGAERVH